MPRAKAARTFQGLDGSGAVSGLPEDFTLFGAGVFRVRLFWLVFQRDPNYLPFIGFGSEEVAAEVIFMQSLHDDDAGHGKLITSA